MYTEFFGLKEEPFNLTPDPRFLYLSKEHKEAFARLQFGVEMRKGLILLTGDVGSGKTTVIMSYINNQPENQHTAMIVNPRIVGSKLLQRICREYGIELDYKEFSKSDILNLLYEYILKKSFYEKNFAVIIDDAHELNSEQFADILLLTKLETNTRKLIQVVLVGLTDLILILKAAEHTALYQRIQIQYNLRPFSYADTQSYIFHRLSVAGYTKKDIFKADAIQRIYQLSKGIPRTISVIASNALLYAYLKGVNKIDHQIVNLSTDESIQGEINGAKQEKISLMDKNFFSQKEEKKQPPEKSFKWWKWLLVFLILILGFLGLNILAQFLIKIFHLF
jgi:general secretion pathway protein A